MIPKDEVLFIVTMIFSAKRCESVQRRQTGQFLVGNNIGHTFITHAPDSSFPSDHVTVFASIALTLLMGGGRRLGGLTLLAAMAVAWARIFLGVHFPLDMLGAAAVDCLAYVLIALAWHRAGSAARRWAITVYRKLLARPIDRGWLCR